MDGILNREGKILILSAMGLTADDLALPLSRLERDQHDRAWIQAGGRIPPPDGHRCLHLAHWNGKDWQCRNRRMRSGTTTFCAVHQQQWRQTAGYDYLKSVLWLADSIRRREAERADPSTDLPALTRRRRIKASW